VFTFSNDGARIHYEVTGPADSATALLFVHGWMGSASARSRPVWSAEAYVNDIGAVAREAAAATLPGCRVGPPE
jgi:pimeloyl-ACP methyl ester carboxylesterase